MNKLRVGASFGISLIVISGVILFSACTAIALAQPKSGMEAQVNTAAAATLIQYLVETKVAEQSSAVLGSSPALALAPAAQAQPTATQVPTTTSTPVPTNTPQPTATTAVLAVQPSPTALPPTAPPAAPRIRADQNTNCRIGPSTAYTVLTIFAKGAESTVAGIDRTKNWWYIASPSAASGSCWVWEGSTTVMGDTSTLAVVDAPYAANTYSGNVFNGYNNNYYNGCGCGCYGYDYNDCGYSGCGYPGCGYYPPDYCGKKINWWNCPPNYNNCTCNPYNGYWNWNPCKKNGCPAVTIVNQKNYCKNYPQCCD